MVRPVKITAPFPSVSETAERLGVSKRDATILSELAEGSRKTGRFEIPGIGRLVRVGRKHRLGANYRLAKAAKRAIAPHKKK